MYSCDFYGYEAKKDGVKINERWQSVSVLPSQIILIKKVGEPSH